MNRAERRAVKFKRNQVGGYSGKTDAKRRKPIQFRTTQDRMVNGTLLTNRLNPSK